MPVQTMSDMHLHMLYCALFLDKSSCDRTLEQENSSPGASNVGKQPRHDPGTNPKVLGVIPLQPPG